MAVTAFDRAGAAFGGGAPVGAAFGVATTPFGQRYLAPNEAAVVGRVVSDKEGGPPLRPNAVAQDGLQRAKLQAAQMSDVPASPEDRVTAAFGGGVAAAASGVNRGLDWLHRHVWEPSLDYLEAGTRMSHDRMRQAWDERDPIGVVKAAGAGPLNWRQDDQFGEHYWSPARDASEKGYGASAAQTQWELSLFNHGGQEIDPETGKTILPLIDDPELWTDRQNYFNHGPQRWVTGVSDAIYAITWDPTVVAGGVAGKAARGARAVSAEDVAEAGVRGRGAEAARRVAERTGAADDGVSEAVDFLRRAGDDATPAGPRAADEVVDAANVSPDGTNAAVATRADEAEAVVESVEEVYKKNRVQRNIEKLTDFMDARFGEVREGGTGAGIRAELMNDPVVKRMGPERGLIVDTAAWVSSTFTDDVIRKGVMDDVWLAAMGDRTALSRIGEVNRRMALDLEGMVSPSGKAVREGIDANPYLTTSEKWNLSNSDDLWQRQKAIIEEDVLEFERGLTDRFAQVAREGRAGLDDVAGEATGVANLTEIPLTTGLQRRIQTSKFLNAFQSVPPVRVLSGTHVPHTLNLTDDEAVRMFDKHVRDSMAVFGRKHDKMFGDEIRDAFAVTRSELAPGAARSERSAVVKKFNNTMTENLSAKLAREKGWDKSEVREWIMSARRQWKNDVDSAVQHMRQAAQKGERVSITAEGAPFAMDASLAKAVSQGHFQQVEALMDWKRMDGLLKRKFTPGQVGKPADLMGDLRDGSNILLNEFTDAWKFAVLLRPVAYPMRVQMDTQFRNAATLGAMETTLNGFRGTGNLLANATGRVKRSTARVWERKMSAEQDIVLAEDRVRPWLRPNGELASDAPADAVRAFQNLGELKRVRDMSADDFRTLMARSNELTQKIPALRKEQRELRSRLADGVIDDAATARVAAIKDELAVLTSEGSETKRLLGGLSLDDLMDEKRIRRGKTGMKRVQGSSQRMNRKGEWESLPDFVHDPYVLGGQSVKTTLMGGTRESTVGLMGHSGDRLSQGLRENTMSRGWHPVEYGTTKATHARWNEAVVTQVNHHIRNDPALMRMAMGAQDDAVVGWMRKTPEGREYWRTQRLTKDGDAKWANEYDLVATQRAHFDNLVPNARAADTVVARDIRAGDLDAWWGEGDVRPLVPNELRQAIDMSGREQLAKRYDTVRNKYFELASVLPETYMGRHPQYKRFFGQHLDRLMKSTGRADFSMEDVRQLRKRADNAARKDMGRIMFDTSHRSELAHMMRFLSPFYSAWEDVMVKWARIIAQRPEVAPLLYKSFDSAASVAVVMDDDNNRIMPNGDVYSVNEDGSLGEKVGINHNPNEGHIVLPIGKWFGGKLGEKTGANDLMLSRGSLNAVFQGEVPWLPGLGPLATVPVNEIMSGRLPGTGEVGPLIADNLKVDIPGVATVDVMTYLQPFGQTDRSPLEQVLPTWMGNMREALDQDSRRFQQTYARLMMNQVNAEELGITPQLTETDRAEKVRNQARNWWWLRLAGSETPVSTRPGTRLDWYFSEFQKYREVHGLDAEERFLEDYPDYGEVTISASMNETGIQATESAHKAMGPWRKQIATHPDVGWALVGPEANQGEFSDAVYTNQISEPIYGPISDKTSRRARTTDEMRTFVSVSNGWREYTQVSRQIDLRLEELGLTSLQASGAEELRQIKDEFKAELGERNPEWKREFDKGFEVGANPAGDFLNSMVDAMSSNPGAVEGRQDLEALQEYMDIREQVRVKMLEAGFKSSAGKEFQGTELYLVWSEFVEDLKRRSPAFEDMYQRARLEQDNLSTDPFAGVRGES